MGVQMSNRIINFFICNEMWIKNLFICIPFSINQEENFVRTYTKIVFIKDDQLQVSSISLENIFYFLPRLPF